MMNLVSNNLLGIYAANPELLFERNEVQKYYNFFEGPAKTKEAAMFEDTRGQSWMQDSTLAYKPSQDIRNQTKKLMLKQKRFMFGVAPDVLMKPYDKKDKDAAEGKRTLIDKILESSNFWANTNKSFLDATIGKRVLLLVEANPDEPIRIKYFNMQDFTYEVDPNDYSTMTSVIIAYLEADTAKMVASKQIWHRWKYYMNESTGTCFLEAGLYNGSAEALVQNEPHDTKLTQLPCRVILNGGLTGDIEGTSDIKDLMDMQNAYNKTLSDYRDALRFKMFEQPVFTNADSESLKDIKIAPNAIIDLQGEPSLSDGSVVVTPTAQMLSSTFSFQVAADAYLDRTIRDMYEIMDQPRPDQLANIPSAKALKFLFYDLMARCEEKWNDWEPALKWTINFIIECVEQFNLYSDDENTQFLQTATSIILEHNYPIPEDEDLKRELAIKEVTGNVRSHKTYIRDFSDIEDEDGEWNEILQEQGEINNAVKDQFQTN